MGVSQEGRNPKAAPCRPLGQVGGAPCELPQPCFACEMAFAEKDEMFRAFFRAQADVRVVAKGSQTVDPAETYRDLLFNLPETSDDVCC